MTTKTGTKGAGQLSLLSELLASHLLKCPKEGTPYYTPYWDKSSASECGVRQTYSTLLYDRHELDLFFASI